MTSILKKKVLTGTMVATFINLSDEEVFAVDQIDKFIVEFEDLKHWMFDLTMVNVAAMPYMDQMCYYLNFNARFNTIVDSFEHAVDFAEIYTESSFGTITIILKDGRHVQLTGFDAIFTFDGNLETVEEALNRVEQLNIADFIAYKAKTAIFSEGI